MKQVLCNIKGERNILFLLFFAAVAVRIYFISRMLDIMPWSDMFHYDKYALEILMGQGYNSAWPPIYIYLLSGLYHFFGHNYWIVQAVQIFISAFTSILILTFISKALRIFAPCTKPRIG